MILFDVTRHLRSFSNSEICSVYGKIECWPLVIVVEFGLRRKVNTFDPTHASTLRKVYVEIL